MSDRAGDLGAQVFGLAARFSAELARGGLANAEDTITRQLDLCKAPQFPWTSDMSPMLGSTQLWLGNVSAARKEESEFERLRVASANLRAQRMSPHCT